MDMNKRLNTQLKKKDKPMNETIISSILGTDNNTIAAIMGATIGGILSFLAYYTLYIKQQKTELKNIAKAMKINFKHLAESEIGHYGDLYKNVNESIQGKMVPEHPLYLDNDLYFSFVHDICKFEDNLSDDIYEFYIDLFRAEMYRSYIQEYKHINGVKEQTFCNCCFTDMKAELMRCNEKIPKIISRLEEAYKI